MSGWTFETSEPEPCGNNNGTTRSKPVSSKSRHAFFADEDENDNVGLRELDSNVKRRDSKTLVSSRRSNRGTRTEVVLVDSDEEYTKDSSLQHPERGQLLSLSRNKVDELAVPDIVVRPISSVDPSIAQQYAHLFVREFLVRTYGNNVVTLFDKEEPMTSSFSLESVHTRFELGRADNVNSLSTKLEQLIAVWDAVTHHAQYSPQVPHQNSIEPASTNIKKSSSKSSSGRKKPTLSVSISPDVPESSSVSKTGEDGIGSSEVDYNRLNHPGHTPKAQSALMSAVMGKPGSTPKASASELRALGFSDVEEEVIPILTSPPRIGTGNIPLDLDMNSELSYYAQCKRVARKHNKNVCLGEPGHTPTKEYVFFRATPPQFVTETIDAAEQVLRDLGGDPTTGLRYSQGQKMERFIELQSSDVSKYRVGQEVERLGAQRNVSGLVSKLYGSRQCGTAGPGTIVIDSWYGNDTPPEESMDVELQQDQDEELDSSSSVLNVYLSEEDDALITQLMG